MTERLYYSDPSLTEFDARVLDVLETPDGRPAVVLDRTAFYPTSGGQPFDTGTLGPARVVDVIDREDGAILHVLEGRLEPGAVSGLVDTRRRFDHTQQHSGQHVLSAAFDRLLGVSTVSFHLGSEVSTIDLAREVSSPEIARAEDEANRVVWSDMPVRIRFVTGTEAARLPLRKESRREGTLRLVEIADFDLSACGGTHVPTTGAIGIIVVTGSERVRGGTRLEFACGGRALRSHRGLRDIVSASVKAASTLPADLPASIERLHEEAREHRREAKELRSRLASHEADALAGAAERIGDASAVIAALADWDASGLKQIASAVAARPGHVAVLVSSPSPSSIVVTRSGAVPVDSAAVLKAMVDRFGGKGGGRQDLAQGGGLSGQVSEMLDYARDLVSRQAAASGGQ